VLLVVLALVGPGCSRMGDSEDSGAGGTAAATDEAADAPQTTVVPDAGGGGRAAEEASDVATAALRGPTDGAKIVKTGSLDLEVRRGRFESAVARITSATVGLGGYVAKSTTSDSGSSPSGSLALRVPVDSFEELLGRVRELGKVGSVSSKGTDVTAQYTDLEARLDALRATRDRLAAVLAEAADVPDILSVQDRITQVQIQIEQLQGQQQVLDDQAAFATLAVALAEPGAAASVPDEGDRGLSGAWADARRRFGDGIEGMVAWSGPLAVFVIVGLLALAAGLAGRRVVRRLTA
jgi:hypothetical protein